MNLVPWTEEYHTDTMATYEPSPQPKDWKGNQLGEIPTEYKSDSIQANGVALNTNKNKM